MPDLDNLDDFLGDDDGDFSLINPKIPEMAEHIADVGLQAGFESWGTFINRGILYQPSGTKYCTAQDLLADESEPQVLTTISWTGDREGTMQLLVPETGCQGAIAYFLAVAMGTEADPEGTALDDEAMDAYSELINTLIAQFAQALRGDAEVGGSIDLSPQSTRIVDLSEVDIAGEFGEDELLCHTGQLTIEGIQPVEVRLLMTVSCTGMSAEIEERKGAGAKEAGASEPATSSVESINRTMALSMRIPFIVVLAAKKMRLQNIQELAPGSIIEFRKLSGENLDIHAGNTKIGEGEVVIVNQHFGIQIRRVSPALPPPRAMKSP